MRVIIDRFEGEYAVVELDGEMLTAPRALFGDACEGDAIQIENLGRAAALSCEDPHRIFERLRHKSRARRRRRHSREDGPDEASHKN